MEDKILNIINSVVPSTNFDDDIESCMSDLDLLEIMMIIERDFNFAIPDEIIFKTKFKKVADLIDWLIKLIDKNKINISTTDLTPVPVFEPTNKLKYKKVLERYSRGFVLMQLWRCSTTGKEEWREIEIED
jgi:acyl carrier protein